MFRMARCRICPDSWHRRPGLARTVTSALLPPVFVLCGGQRCWQYRPSCGDGLFYSPRPSFQHCYLVKCLCCLFQLKSAPCFICQTLNICYTNSTTGLGEMRLSFHIFQPKCAVKMNVLQGNTISVFALQNVMFYLKCYLPILCNYFEIYYQFLVEFYHFHLQHTQKKGFRISKISNP